MRKTAIWLYLVLVLVLMGGVLTGCAEGEKEHGSSFMIYKDGTVRVHLQTPFDKDYYNLNELQSMIRGEIEEYNRAEGSGSIVLESLTEENGICNAVFRYADVETYAEYNEMYLFWGTIEAAKNAGVDLDISMVTEAKNGQMYPIGREELMETPSSKLLIWSQNEGYVMEVPGKIRAYSSNLTKQGKKRIAAVEGAEGPFYLLYK